MYQPRCFKKRKAACMCVSVCVRACTLHCQEERQRQGKIRKKGDKPKMLFSLDFFKKLSFKGA